MKTTRSCNAGLGWTAILLAPAAIPLAMLAGLFARPAARTPEQVIALLNGFLDGTDARAWDDLESVPIADPFLETIRRRAIPMGPPHADEAGLRSLLAELTSRYPEAR